MPYNAALKKPTQLERDSLSTVYNKIIKYKSLKFGLRDS